MCPRLVYSDVMVYSNALLYVSLFLLPTDLRWFSPCEQEERSPRSQRGYGRPEPLGGRDTGIPHFKMPTLNKGTLRAKYSMRDGYRSKMLLYVLDKLFYIYAQVKNSQRTDDKLVLAYEILCISTNCYTDRWNGVEKTHVPDALALLNVEDIRHLKHLTWVVYDGVLLVGPWPGLLGDHPWCTVLAGLQRHIYRGRDDEAHCPPQTLSSWDHEERVETLHHVGGLSSA